MPRSTFSSIIVVWLFLAANGVCGGEFSPYWPYDGSWPTDFRLKPHAKLFAERARGGWTLGPQGELVFNVGEGSPCLDAKEVDALEVWRSSGNGVWLRLSRDKLKPGHHCLAWHVKWPLIKIRNRGEHDLSLRVYGAVEQNVQVLDWEQRPVSHARKLWREPNIGGQKWALLAAGQAIALPVKSRGLYRLDFRQARDQDDVPEWVKLKLQSSRRDESHVLTFNSEPFRHYRLNRPWGKALWLSAKTSIYLWAEDAGEDLKLELDHPLWLQWYQRDKRMGSNAFLGPESSAIIELEAKRLLREQTTPQGIVQHRRLLPKVPVLHREFPFALSQVNDAVLRTHKHARPLQGLWRLQSDVPLSLPSVLNSGRIRLRLLHSKAVSTFTLHSSAGDIAVEYDPNTALPSLHAANRPGAQVHIHELFIDLPGKVQTLVVRQGKGTPWLDIAYPEFRPYRLSEQRYLRLKASLGPELLSKVMNGEELPPELQYLHRWLKQRDKAFKAGLSDSLEEKTPLSIALLNQWYIEGEHFFAVEQASGAFLFRRNGAEYFDWLLRTLPQESLAREQLLVSYLFRFQDVHEQLVWALLKKGQFRRALILAHLMTNSWPPALAEVLATVATTQGWHQSAALFAAAAKLKAPVECDAQSPGTWLASPLLSPLLPAVQTSVFNPDLGTRYTRWYLDEGTQWRTKVQGPATLRLQLNPLHSHRNSTVNGRWIIRHNTEEKFFPVVNNRVFNRHQSDGLGYPGSSEVVELRLGEGVHELGVETSFASLFLIQRRVPFGALNASGNLPLTEQLSSELADVAFAKLPLRPIKAFGEVADQGLSACTQVAEDLQAMPGVLISTQPALAENKEAAEVLPGIRLADEDLAQNPLPQKGLSLSEAQRAIAQLWSLYLARKMTRYQRSLANAIAFEHRSDPFTQKLLNAVNSGFRWQEESNVFGGDGRITFDFNSWQAVSPFARRRAHVLTPSSNSKLIRENETYVLRLWRPRKGEIVLNLRFDKEGFRAGAELPLQVRLNQEKAKTLLLNESKPIRNVVFSLTPGAHEIRIRPLGANRNHWLWYAVAEVQGGQWKDLPSPYTLGFFSAESSSARVYVDGASWLRIDSFDGRKAQSQYRWVPRAGYVSLDRAALGANYFRVMSLQPAERVQPPPLTEFAGGAPYPPLSQPIGFTPSQDLSSHLPNPVSRGTHGGYVDWRHRRNVEDGEYLSEPTASDASERFVQAGWRYRQAGLQRNWHWESDLFFRRHDASTIGPVLGTQQWWSWRPPGKQWRGGIHGRGFYQSGSQQFLWSAYLESCLFHSFPLPNNFRATNEFTLFKRELSLDDSLEPVDDDIFSQYKSQHDAGWQWESGFSQRTKRDRRWKVAAVFRGNRDIGDRLDQWWINARYDRFWRSNKAWVALENRRYLSDLHRASGNRQQSASLGWSWWHWQEGGQRWQFGFKLSHHVESGATAGQIGISWDKSARKGRFDFRPESSPFHELESLNALQDIRGQDE